MLYIKVSKYQLCAKAQHWTETVHQLVFSKTVNLLAIYRLCLFCKYINPIRSAGFTEVPNLDMKHDLLEVKYTWTVYCRITIG